MLSLLAYPLSQTLLLSLLALLCMYKHWRKPAMWLLGVAFTWLYVCSTALFADFLMGTLEDKFRPKALSVVPKADAIVVLGGASRGDTHWSSMGDLGPAADRLLHAAILYRAGKAPFVLVSGGGEPGFRPEAEIMKESLIAMGIPERAIVRERESRDTRGNASYSAVILHGKRVENIHLVTSAFHMRRAVPLFEREGFRVIPAPTDYQRLVAEPAVPRWLPTVDDLQRSTWALREYVGFVVYQYRGWL